MAFNAITPSVTTMPTTPQMSCPLGGTFYACGTASRFIGCCTINPCTSNGCPAGNLQPASFLASQHGQIPDEDCDSSDAQFYSCNSTTPTFWGCCKGNPCGMGSCEGGILGGAKLFEGEKAGVYLSFYNGSWVGGGEGGDGGSGEVVEGAAVGSATTQSATQSATLPESTPATGSSTSTATSQSSSSSNIGAIAGGAVGGFAVFAALIFGIIFLFRRRKQSPNHASSPPYPNIEDQQPHSHPSATAPYQPQVVEEIKQQPQGKVTRTQSDPHNHLLTKTTGASPYPNSPQLGISHPNSPQAPYSPAPPPSYWDEQRSRHMSYELAGSPGGQELESGQMYHPYRQSGLGSSRS